MSLKERKIYKEKSSNPTTNHITKKIQEIETTNLNASRITESMLSWRVFPNNERFTISSFCYPHHSHSVGESSTLSSQ